MPLAFVLVFGAAMLIYMGLENVSFSGLLSDQQKPISDPLPSIGSQVGSAIGSAGNSIGSALGSSKGVIGGNLHQGRTDMGVDFTGSGPIPAVIDGIVTRVDPRGSNSGWPGGAMVVVKGIGQYAGKFTYLAENLDPTVRVGQQVRKGDTLGNAVGVSPFIEYGEAANEQGQTLSAAHGTQNTHPNHALTPEGIDFTHFLGLNPQ